MGLILLLLVQWLAVSQRIGEVDGAFATPAADKDAMAWVAATYDSLTVEQRIAQSYMLAAHTDSAAEMLRVERMIKAGKAGGVIFFKGHPTTQLYWTNRLQAAAPIPLMIGIDGEWGIGMRLDSVPIFPHQLALGAISDNTLIRQMGVEIGKSCRRMGIHVNFAPVVDINNNPLNPVINDRSFGEDKMKVAIKGLEYMHGLQETGVMACAKHFPGHGDTDKDSHKTLPTINKTLIQLENYELYPFRLMLSAGIGGMMVAHLAMPALDTTSGISASLSRPIITGLLKQQMGFEGLIFSDALNMKGVTSQFPAGMVDSIAYMAGTDILEFSENPELGLTKLLKAYTDSTLADSIVSQRTKKILSYKYRLGLSHYTPLSIDNLYYDLNTDSATDLRRLLYEKALTVAANDSGILPMRDMAYKRTASLSIDCKGVSDFQRSCYEYAELPLYNVPNEKEESLSKIYDSVKGYERVIIDLHGMSRLGSTNYGINKTTLDFIDILSHHTQVVLVLFGSPYSLKYFDSLATVLVAYEDNEATNLAAASLLYGALPALGHLPVTASPRYPAGRGIIIDSTIRLKLSIPSEVRVSAEDLSDMNDVVLNGIIAHAYPGCQVLVAMGGKVIWNRTYGSKIYENSKDKIQTTDLYDLASISKIASTTLAVMKLVDMKLLDINKMVGDYLPLDDSATIKHLRIADVLTHQAGLKPFFEFYRPTLASTKYQIYYRRVPSDTFPIIVCDSLCLRRDYPDSMWHTMSHSDIKPDAGYVYSDVDFYILQKIVEQISSRPLDRYMNETFYRPMGLTRIGYIPSTRFARSRIVPTERDTAFRHQLVHGYVHDPGSAMYGGVAGHAGVFSNALDLAQVMQLLLNGGTYNGIRFMSAETVALFTRQYNPRSRRGLGFDKPEPDAHKPSPTCENVPPSTFGHTGFTGTSVWSDPDNDLTFIFLSNRGYPDAENPKLVKMNIRTDLQRIVYKVIGKVK